MSYRIPDPHPVVFWNRLKQLPEFEHLVDGEARIEWLLRDDEYRKQGRKVLGACYLPSVQGSLSGLFDWLLANHFGGEEPVDFLIILDREFWESSDDKTREILVYHELCHAAQAVNRDGDPRFDKDGRPVWSIRGHDVEEFVAVARRYGAYNSDLRALIAAANES